ncbi:MAG: alpha/beta hydrolase [Acidimicrobiales bacterium]
MTEVIELWPLDRWPDGPPTDLGEIPPESSFVLDEGAAAGAPMLRNISEASLTVFPPDAGTANGKGVIVVPGGGWTINAWTHEGLDVATWLNELGYTAFVLKYRVQASPADPEEFAAIQAASDGLLSRPIPHADKPTAIGDLIDTDAYHRARAAAADDGRRAIEVVRAEAERFGIDGDALGMVGFSAGAFLIVDIALDPRADQVAWIAPIYGGETQGASVPADAPPLFTAVAQDDLLVRIVEGLHRDWVAADRSAEFHEFRRGGHGFGMTPLGLPSDSWADLLVTWMRDLDADASA